MIEDDTAAPRPAVLRERIGELEAGALAMGRHEEVAARLRAAGRSLEAGLVLEEIWAFRTAGRDLLRADATLHALRVAIEARDPALLEDVLVALETQGAETKLERAAALLTARGRDTAAARMLSAARADPVTVAGALERGGDVLGAAQALSTAGDPRGALAVLERNPTAGPRAHSIAMAAWWSLGDAEQCARAAQRALAAGSTDPRVRPLLAAALSALGHHIAAQVVLERVEPQQRAAIPGLRGRYHVTGVLPAGLAGTAWVGVDRATLREVEIHLLLGDRAERERPEPEVRDALVRFAAAAEAGAALDHPAIRPILHLDPREGLVVLPRAPGGPLRNLVRHPGLASSPLRARSLARFCLDGLAAGHARGLVHGGIAPSRLMTDELGRPLLGPFGAHELAGLAATHTGGLQEILLITAPEVRRGARPGPEADVYAVAATTVCLLLGELAVDAERLRANVEPDLAQALLAALADDPAARPRARELAHSLHARVGDVTRMGATPDAADSSTARIARETWPGDRLQVHAADSWSDAALEELCASAAPRLQTIIDRDGRLFELAPWPTQCRRLPEGTDVRSIVDTAQVADSATLRSEIEARLRTDAVVVTPAGDWMLALDAILPR